MCDWFGLAGGVLECMEGKKIGVEERLAGENKPWRVSVMDCSSFSSSSVKVRLR